MRSGSRQTGETTVEVKAIKDRSPCPSLLHHFATKEFYVDVIRRLVNEQRARTKEAGRGQDWAKVSMSLTCKVAAMALRGLWLRPQLSACRGLPLIGRGVTVRNRSFVRFGANVLVEDDAEIQGLSREGIQFGDDVSIGSQTMIRPSSYYSRKIGVGLSIGNNSSIGPQGYVGCSGGISIGDNVMIGPGVRMFSENHNFHGQDNIKSQGVVWSPIVIEDDCWIASGVTITAGVSIGQGAVIAAGAVVTKSVAENAIMAGVPAREIGRR